MSAMLKVEPHVDYPPEDGRYLRGNDYSPVAVAVILIYNQEDIPPDIEYLVRVGVECGAALSGTLQTESIGIEKIVCNITANPNIRYLVICGPESPGHLCGEALLTLLENGVDERRRIIGAQARTPYLLTAGADECHGFFGCELAVLIQPLERSEAVALAKKCFDSLLSEMAMPS